MMKDTTVRPILKDLSKRFGVSITYRVIKERIGGWAVAEDGKIVINKRINWTRGKLLSYALHEIVHVLCHREKKFVVFHSSRWPEEMSTIELIRYITTAWSAELYVEQRAKMMLLEMFPREKFWFAYNAKGYNKAWYDESEIDPYRRELRRRKLRAIDKRKRAECTGRAK